MCGYSSCCLETPDGVCSFSGPAQSQQGHCEVSSSNDHYLEIRGHSGVPGSSGPCLEKDHSGLSYLIATAWSQWGHCGVLGAHGCCLETRGPNGLFGFSKPFQNPAG